MSPIASVLIPCYHAQATIVETVEGLLAQPLKTGNAFWSPTTVRLMWTTWRSAVFGTPG